MTTTPVAYIAQLLGKGTPRLSIITSAVLASISLFYIYIVGSYFKFIVYTFEHRITYYTFFDVYIINKYVDHTIIAAGTVLWLTLSLRGKVKFVAPVIYTGIIIIAAAASLDTLVDIAILMSIPVVISFLIYDRFVFKKWKKNILNMYANLLLVNYFAIIGIVTGIIGIIISTGPLFSIAPNSIPIHNYAYDIFVFFSSFSPVLMLLLISCLPVKLLIKEFLTGILKIKNNSSGSLPHTSNDRNDNNNSIKSSRSKIIYLVLFMLLSVGVALIPHQPTINKDNQQIGVDTDYYVRWVSALIHSHNPLEFIQQAFVIQNQGDRPLTLIFLFTIGKLVNADLFYITEHLPVILGPALVLVVYFLTRELIPKNDITSLLASFLTAMSFQILIGIYAGFYANWIALIIGYLSSVFLFKFLKSPSNRLNFVIYSVLMILLLFSHVYTWSVMVIVMGVFLAVMLKLDYYRRGSIVLLLLVVLSSVFIDLARMAITGSAGGIEKDIHVAIVTEAGLDQFILRWSNLTRTIYSYVGGQFSNFIILTLGLYWLFRSNLREPSSIFLIIFLSIGFIPFLFGNYFIQTRVFYDIPFQIPAAIGLSFIRKQIIGSRMLLPICVWLIAMSIRSVSNFYLIFPS
jgi:hypothetical protein